MERKKPKVYLASPWFKENEKALYDTIVKAIRKKNEVELYVPQEHTIENADLLSNYVWGAQVFDEDIWAINDCDEVWVINFGLYSDSGTAWECGYAYGLGKKIRMFVNNYDKEQIYSLMMINGCYSVEAVSNLITDGNIFPEIEVK